ncbi:MAG: hypothetical protein ACJAZS_000687 [Alteromonas naphthalenivorans]|jgi:hypothetical protein
MNYRFLLLSLLITNTTFANIPNAQDLENATELTQEQLEIEEELESCEQEYTEATDRLSSTSLLHMLETGFIISISNSDSKHICLLSILSTIALSLRTYTVSATIEQLRREKHALLKKKEKLSRSKQ